jgi:hypothetical protein
MGDGDTLTLWREKMIQKPRERDVPESGLERKADELMAPILAVQGIAQARRQQAMRRMRARGWFEETIQEALVELALRRGDRFLRQREGPFWIEAKRDELYGLGLSLLLDDAEDHHRGSSSMYG